MGELAPRFYMMLQFPQPQTGYTTFIDAALPILGGSSSTGPGSAGSRAVHSPGYPLQTPSNFWKLLAISAYVFSGLIAFKEEVLPKPFMGAVYSIFRDHDTIVKLGIGAVAIHVGYALYVANEARGRKYDAKATAWWSAMSFAFGFIGVKMFLDKEAS